MNTDKQSGPSPDVELLAIGDVHLGTRCSGLPPDVRDWGINDDELTPAAALAAAPGGVQVHIFWGMGEWGSWGIGAGWDPGV